LFKLLWNRETGAREQFRLARSKGVHPIWDWKDPVPAIAYLTLQFFPDLAWSALRRLSLAIRRKIARGKQQREAACED
jgi:hypothetical protein